MKKRLITAALPYVNNIPHLGNLIQVLSADVFARFCRSYGYDTLYVCGTDEYGTATETKALEMGVSPRELCDRFHSLHREIYSWFNISFDHFGRTTTDQQTAIVQDIFNRLDEAGYIRENEVEQLYCPQCRRFLADRHIQGDCPHCEGSSARGDQCEDCGKLLDSTELVNPRCGVCGVTPEIRRTSHLYIDLPAIRPSLEEWIEKASGEGFWAHNALQMTRSWIRDGLKERAITRDLDWGIPVPKEGFKEKVFYVWFDAPIGYISITAAHRKDWKGWWQNPGEVELYQFIGKDNIPFHTVLFPSSLLASGQGWTLLHHISSTEYLNYENSKFSKSKGVGIFGNDCQETGISTDVWRFYLLYNRPEKSDSQFSWLDFQEKINSELIGNFGNFVNRTLSFVHRFCKARLPQGKENKSLWREVRQWEASITKNLDRGELREGLRGILGLSDLGNKVFQEGEPWRKRTEAPEEMEDLLFNLLYLLRDLTILIRPYLPDASDRVGEFLGLQDFSWASLGQLEGLGGIQEPRILFHRLEDDLISSLRESYGGKPHRVEKNEGTLEKDFRDVLDLRVAKILKVENHPEADKLYVITLDAGEERTICSGLVENYSIGELEGRKIILAFNLKPAKLRGIKSDGMLLAAEDGETMEVVFLPTGEPGNRILLEGDGEALPVPERKVRADRFFEIPIRVKDHTLHVGETALCLKGQPIRTERVASGVVN